MDVKNYKRYLSQEIYKLSVELFITGIIIWHNLLVHLKILVLKKLYLKMELRIYIQIHLKIVLTYNK